MRFPDPLVTTKREAYLAIKSDILSDEQYDKVYKPELHFADNHLDAWLAVWAGLYSDYPEDAEGNPEIL